MSEVSPSPPPPFKYSNKIFVRDKANHWGEFQASEVWRRGLHDPNVLPPDHGDSAGAVRARPAGVRDQELGGRRVEIQGEGAVPGHVARVPRSHALRTGEGRAGSEQRGRSAVISVLVE